MRSRQSGPRPPRLQRQEDLVAIREARRCGRVVRRGDLQDREAEVLDGDGARMTKGGRDREEEEEEVGDEAQCDLGRRRGRGAGQQERQEQQEEEEQGHEDRGS